MFPENLSHLWMDKEFPPITAIKIVEIKEVDKYSNNKISVGFNMYGQYDDYEKDWSLKFFECIKLLIRTFNKGIECKDKNISRRIHINNAAVMRIGGFMNPLVAWGSIRLSNGLPLDYFYKIEGEIETFEFTFDYE